MPLLEINNLGKVYQTGEISYRALEGITFDIDEGEFAVIAGPSGSGKTTLLNIIGCLDSPTEGSIRLNGEDITNLTYNEKADIRRKRLGFVFQSYNLIPVLSAAENVAYPLILNKVKPSEVNERVNEILTQVGLADKTKNFSHQLSGGQQQRVSIARALVHRPSIVLADEPTANLDTKTGKEIIALMRKLNKENHTTFIFATHDPSIMEMATVLIKLQDGRQI